ncbi:histidinol-phosphate transaminase [Rhodobacteraceae bacterium W635]|uniref:histidinol-phosphate transaminase n=1 Tax=Nioella halotolerans TaxID=2303578 RepID=UPI000E3BFA6C|nr:histidinol-phosphate transaminase [Rhodobacteraceae bacterium W635]
MTQIRPQPGIMDIALYQGGGAAIAGQDKVLKLSSNENPFGPSPAAVAAVQAVAAEMHLYPPTDHGGLRRAIGAAHGLDPERVICGVGSDEIITFLCQAYAGPGDEVLHTEHGFLMYRISALAAGATPVVAPEAGRRVDVDAILSRVTARTRLVFIANPNNPTGTMIDTAEVTRLADGLPGDSLLVLDGAYAEYVEGYDGGAALVDARDNVVMTRTFSKIYGLGGLRVGWGYGPRAIIDVLNRVRGPFNLSTLALAGAEAAVRDTGYVDHCRAVNATERARLAAGMASLGYPSDPSEGNFILCRMGDAATAKAADAHLKSKGIIVRLVAGYGLPGCLRITVGSEADVTRVLAAMQDFGGAA